MITLKINGIITQVEKNLAKIESIKLDNQVILI